jgi:hypothetical protein
VIRDCNICLGQKLENTCSSMGERIIVQQKYLENRSFVWKFWTEEPVILG